MQKKEYTYLRFVRFNDVENWSVSHILGMNIGFTNAFPMVPIGQIIEKSTKSIEVKDDIQYKQITLKINGGGTLLRDVKYGKDIGTKRQYVVSSGQFIMSKIDARNGAFGVISDDLDGAIVTADFPVFNVNSRKVVSRYLFLLSATKAFIRFAQSCSRGTTNRQRMDIGMFLSKKIPLPSYDIQQSLVNAYNAKIQKAADLEQQAEQRKQEIEDYLLTELGINRHNEIKSAQNNGYKFLEFVRFKDINEWGIDKISKILPQNETYQLSKLNTLIKEGYRGKSPIYKESGQAFILNQKCNRWNEIDLSYKKSVDEKWLLKIKKELFTQEGDLLINSTGEGTLGRATVITKNFANLLYDSHLLLIRVNEKVLPNYLVLILNSSYGQNQVNTYKSALATKQTELGLENLKKVQIPLPPLSIQNAMVEYINEQNSQIKELQQQAANLRKKALEEFEKEVFE